MYGENWIGLKNPEAHCIVDLFVDLQGTNDEGHMLLHMKQCVTEVIYPSTLRKKMNNEYIILVYVFICKE